AVQRQRLTLGPRLSRDAPESVQLLAAAFGALRRFTIKHKRFEGMFTVPARVLVQRHYHSSFRRPYVRRFLYTSLARNKIWCSLSVRLLWPSRATFSRTASSLASSWSSASAFGWAVTAAGCRGSSR